MYKFGSKTALFGEDPCVILSFFVTLLRSFRVLTIKIRLKMMERISDLELERYEMDVRAILDNINDRCDDEDTFEVYQAFKDHDWWFAPSSIVEDLKEHLEETATLLSKLQKHIR